MLEEMSSAHVAEWMAYYRLEPWGEERADRRAALVACTVANIHRKKGTRAFRVEEFMPKYDRPAQHWKVQKQMFMALTGAG